MSRTARGNIEDIVTDLEAIILQAEAILQAGPTVPRVQADEMERYLAMITTLLHDLHRGEAEQGGSGKRMVLIECLCYRANALKDRIRETGKELPAGAG